MAIVDQTSSFLGSLGKLNYIKYYSLSISKVYSMWTLLTMSLLPPYGSWWHTIIIMTLKWYPLQNCWLSDKVTVILNVESKFLRKKLIFVKPFTCASPNMMKRHVFVLFHLLKKFTCSSSYLTKLRISRSWLFKNINSLFLNQVNARK